MNLVTQPDFSIVIVNYNTAELLRACIESIERTRGAVTVEIIVVDNGSRDNSVAVAQEACPSVRALPQGRNLGYVPANNVGLHVCTGRYVMYLNPDTELCANCPQHLLAFLGSHPKVGAVSGRVMNPDGTDQGVARKFPSVMNGLFG